MQRDAVCTDTDLRHRHHYHRRRHHHTQQPRIAIVIDLLKLRLSYIHGCLSFEQTSMFCSIRRQIATVVPTIVDIDLLDVGIIYDSSR